MTHPPASRPDQGNRHAGAPANDLPGDIEGLLTVANTVDVDEEPTRKNFARFSIAATACLVVVAFVVIAALMWAMWAISFYIPGFGACDPYSGACPELPWHDWVSSWFGM